MTTADAIMHALRDNMDELQALKDELKRRSMVYQYDLKVRAAKLEGVDPETLFHLPYPQWAALVDKHYEVLFGWPKKEATT